MPNYKVLFQKTITHSVEIMVAAKDKASAEAFLNSTTEWKKDASFDEDHMPENKLINIEFKSIKRCKNKKDFAKDWDSNCTPWGDW